MAHDSNYYLDKCNSFLNNGLYSEAEECLDKAFHMDSYDDSLNIKKLFAPQIFHDDDFYSVKNELLDDYVNKSIAIIEMYIESANINLSDILCEKLELLLIHLRLLIRLCRNNKQWSLIYKTMGDIHILLNDKLNAFESYRYALYYNKSETIKTLYMKLADDYGERYRISDVSFNFKLLNNIFFKSVQVDIDDNAPRNKKYLIDDDNSYVEDVAINYYANKGFNAFHSENYFWSFNAEVFFRDIDQDYRLNHKDSDIYKKDIYKRVNECKKIRFEEFLEKYYYSNKFLEYHKGAFSSKFEGYYTDYVEFDGYDEWVKRIDAIGVDKCLRLIGERHLHTINSRLPFSGLPDVFVYRDKQGFFVEVKSTNDKLSYKQKWWHEYISDELNIPVVIFMVNRSERQIKSMKKHYLV